MTPKRKIPVQTPRNLQFAMIMNPLLNILDNTINGRLVIQQFLIQFLHRREDGLARPALAHLVLLPKRQPVPLVRTREAIIQGVTPNLVVMVNEPPNPLRHQIPIILRAALVRMPRQIDIKHGDKKLLGIQPKQMQELIIAIYSPAHCSRSSRIPDPAVAVHLINKDALALYVLNKGLVQFLTSAGCLDGSE